MIRLKFRSEEMNFEPSNEICNSLEIYFDKNCKFDRIDSFIFVKLYDIDSNTTITLKVNCMIAFESELEESIEVEIRKKHKLIWDKIKTDCKIELLDWVQTVGFDVFKSFIVDGPDFETFEKMHYPRMN